MATVTVLSAIDYSEAQAGVQWVELDTDTGIGTPKWYPARIFNIPNLRSAYRRYYTGTIYGIAFYDRETQLNEAYEAAHR